MNSSKGQNPYKVTVLINGVNLSMEIDTAASTLVMDENIFHNLSHPGKVLKSNAAHYGSVHLHRGGCYSCSGECWLEVQYNGFKGNVPAVVISGAGPCLLGRNWLQHIFLDWSAFFNLATMKRELNAILEVQSMFAKRELGK